MTEHERELAEHAVRLLRKRKLMRDYHLSFWELEEIPAPFLDDLMRADMVEAHILDNQSKKK